jgi:hypothetical protein
VNTSRWSPELARSVTALVPSLLWLTCSTETPKRSSAPAATDSIIAESDSTATTQLPDTDQSPQSVQQNQPNPGLLTPDGWGPLRIGMSRAQVVAAAGEDANPDAVGGPDPQTCDEFHPRNAPEGVLVMIQQGVLTRITVSKNPDITTPAGIRVSDRGATVLAKLGAQARAEPHKYWEPPAKYVTVWRAAPSDSERRGIRYEINSDDVIVHLRGGGPSIEYVEGCL